jgi:photosystem II stability/assembly factor-like uncharacterized protein
MPKSKARPRTRIAVRGRAKPTDAVPKPRGSGAVTLFVATKKGAWILRSDATRRSWGSDGPHFLGQVVNHVVLDPRDGTTLLAGVRTGHLGPTVYRSLDAGKTWKEAASPPRFPKVPEGRKGRAVKAVFWLTPSPASRPGEWWAGTTPHGMFRSKDGGASWEECTGFTRALEGWEKTPGRVEEVPEGSITHSVIVDPRDPRHLYVGLSQGGFFESVDEGNTWKPLNEGVLADFLPEKYPEFGQDPHCVAIHPKTPDRLWQQNHCGLYLLERPGTKWDRIGNNLPKAVGDVGFNMVLHPRDPRAAWVVPMDGTQAWPRTSVDGKPCVFRTRDLGKTWERQQAGMPSRAWWTVKRQAACADSGDPAGVYLGTTSGEVWASPDEGASWAPIASHLPHVLAVTAAPGA